MKKANPETLPQIGWVREPVVLAVVPFGKTKLREEVAAGRFPAPKKFSTRVVAFDAEAVHRWIRDQRQTTSRIGYATSLVDVTHK